MKKRLLATGLSMILAASMLVTGCGKEADTPAADSTEDTDTGTDTGGTKGSGSADAATTEQADILPDQTRILDLGYYGDHYLEDGMQPEDTSGLTAEIFNDRMFWGKWVLEGSSRDDFERPSDSSFAVTLDDTDYDLYIFPKSMYLGTYLADSVFGTTRQYASFEDGIYASLGFDENEDADDDMMGMMTISATGQPGDTVVSGVFHTEDDTLALGLGTRSMSTGFSEGDDFPIEKELDYTFTWSGPYLTLSMNGESAVYVPFDYEHEDGEMDIPGTSFLASSSDDGIYTLTMSQDEDILERKYDMPQMVDFSIESDGSLTAVDDAGDAHALPVFYYTGSTITLGTSASDVSMLKIDEEELTHEYTSFGSGFLLDGEWYNTVVGTTLSSLIEKGYTTTQDTSAVIGSREKADLDLTYRGNLFHVKVINTYDKSNPLTYCRICSFEVGSEAPDVEIQTAYSDDSSAMLSVNKSLYTDVKGAGTLYSSGRNSIVFKAAEPYVIRTISVQTFDDDGPGNEIIHNADNKSLLLFEFDDDVVSSIIFVDPVLLYAGLDQNIDVETLATMSDQQIQEASEVRAGILSLLQDALAQSGTDAEIDEETGVIRMSNDVLFDTDSSEVKSAGQEYLNRIMAAVASVVLDQDVSDALEKVEIAGHTDPTGTFDYNFILSLKRAQSVLGCFLDSGSLDSTQKEEFRKLADIQGYSYSDPVYNEDGSVNNDASRRVEIRFFVKTDGSRQALAAGSSQKTDSTGTAESTDGPTLTFESGTSASESESGSETGTEAAEAAASTDSSRGTFQSGYYTNPFLGFAAGPFGSDWSVVSGTQEEMDAAYADENWYEDFYARYGNGEMQTYVQINRHDEPLTDQTLDDITTDEELDDLVQSYYSDDEDSVACENVSATCEDITFLNQHYKDVCVTGAFVYDFGTLNFWHHYLTSYKGQYQIQITLASAGEDYTDTMKAMFTLLSD